MDVKTLGVAVLVVGLGLLSSVADADHHGGNHTELPAGCNGTAVRECVAPFMAPGPLAPFTSGNVTKDYLAGVEVATNPALWQQVCSSMQSVVACLRPSEEQCLNSSQGTTFRSLLQLDFHVPSVADLLRGWKELCTSRVYCLSRLTNCTTTYADALKELKVPQPDVTNQALCRSAGLFHDCIIQDVPPYCRAIPEMVAADVGTTTFRRYCEQVSCQPLVTCKRPLEAAGPSPTGLDDKTCFLYRNFSRCAGEAVTNCSSVVLPQGEPTPGVVSTLIEEACTAMGEEGINAIYNNCAHFSTCIAKTFAGKDTMFLGSICPTFQGVVRCALESVGVCAGVDAQKRSEFESQATALALRAQALGCGTARVLAEKCTALETCRQTYQAGQSSAFADMCTKIQTFQSCASTAVQGCNLTGPATPPAGAVRVPRLAVLSTITKKMCDAMQGQTLPDCPEFLNCTATIVRPMEPEWKMMSGRAWCDFSVRMVECARSFRRTCTVTGSFEADIEAIYRDLLLEGCPNTFQYVIPPTTTAAPDKTTKPTSGAQTLTAVSMMTMPILVFLSRL